LTIWVGHSWSSYSSLVALKEKIPFDWKQLVVPGVIQSKVS